MGKNIAQPPCFTAATEIFEGSVLPFYEKQSRLIKISRT